MAPQIDRLASQISNVAVLLQRPGNRPHQDHVGTLRLSGPEPILTRSQINWPRDKPSSGYIFTLSIRTSAQALPCVGLDSYPSQHEQAHLLLKRINRLAYFDYLASGDLPEQVHSLHTRGLLFPSLLLLTLMS